METRNLGLIMTSLGGFWILKSNDVGSEPKIE
jgi:hypothetical protein